MQDNFQYEFAAHISQHQTDEADNRPNGGPFPAPCRHTAFQQQPRINKPRHNAENGFMRERHRTAEYLLGKKRTADNRNRQQGETYPHTLKHHPLQTQ